MLASKVIFKQARQFSSRTSPEIPYESVDVIQSRQYIATLVTLQFIGISNKTNLWQQNDNNHNIKVFTHTAILYALLQRYLSNRPHLHHSGASKHGEPPSMTQMHRQCLLLPNDSWRSVAITLSGGYEQSVLGCVLWRIYIITHKCSFSVFLYNFIKTYYVAI